MNIRKIREDLGRSKSSLQRRELPRALFLFATALKELGAQPAPMDLRGDIRTALAELCADPEYRKESPKALTYQPGKERELLQAINALYKAIIGQEGQEEYQETLNRKLNIDRCFRDGRQFLAQKRPSDADECFTELFKYYRNEFAVHGMIARAMMDAGEYVRALGYLRNGLKERPDDVELRQLAETCLRQRSSHGR